jgi:GNAT superfamily N-acetyltransferase
MCRVFPIVHGLDAMKNSPLRDIDLAWLESSLRESGCAPERTDRVMEIAQSILADQLGSIGLVSREEEGNRSAEAPLGMGLASHVAGTESTWAIHLVHVTKPARGRRIGSRLLQTLVTDCGDRGAELLVAEIEGDGGHEATAATLLGCSFTLETVIPDLTAEDTPTLVFVRPLRDFPQL